MKLQISHRLLLLQILPDESSIDILRIVRDLKKVLGFTEEELKHTLLRQEESMFVWGDPDAEDKEAAAEAVDKPVEIEVGERAFDVIKSALNTASNNNQLTAPFIPFYEHFVEQGPWLLDEEAKPT